MNSIYSSFVDTAQVQILQLRCIETRFIYLLVNHFYPVNCMLFFYTQLVHSVRLVSEGRVPMKRHLFEWVLDLLNGTSNFRSISIRD